MNDDVSLEEQFESVTRRWGDWDQYKLNYFTRLNPGQRANELAIFDKALHDEARVSKEYSSYWVRRRELEALDDLMRRAGR